MDLPTLDLPTLDLPTLDLGVPLDPARRSLLAYFVETYMPLAEPEQAAFEQLVAVHQEYVKVGEMITVYEPKGD